MATLTFVHVAVSLIGIGAGLVVLFGLLTARRADTWTAVFLSTTVATSVTAFGFPLDPFLPSHVVGLVSLAVLALTIYARYSRRLVGVWRPVYAVTAVLALYLNVFVLIVQAFLKVPVLTAMAPTQSEPPFLIGQLVALVTFIVLGALSAMRFRPILDGPFDRSSLRRSSVA